jgi:hypothetical protein
MIVLDMQPYDAILGYDCLRAQKQMAFDWEAKTMTFMHQGKDITLQGLQTPSMEVNAISATKAYKSVQGNGV